MLLMAVPLVCKCVYDFLMNKLALCRDATLPLVYEWVNADLCCKNALSSWKTREAQYKYSPFTI